MVIWTKLTHSVSRSRSRSCSTAIQKNTERYVGALLKTCRVCWIVIQVLQILDMRWYVLEDPKVLAFRLIYKQYFIKPKIEGYVPN